MRVCTQGLQKLRGAIGIKKHGFTAHLHPRGQFPQWTFGGGEGAGSEYLDHVGL